MALAGELSASRAVLGLVVEQADTVAGVALRLAERYPRAGFAVNSAHQNLPSLKHQGLVLVVEEGEKRSLDRYRATPTGVDSFHEWLRESAATLPVLRDALRARLGHVREVDDLLAVIHAIRAQEDACTREYARAHQALQAAQRLGRLHPRTDADWRTRVQSALMTDEAMLWAMRARRLQRLREDLEDPADQDDQTDGG
jgi:DNA-binding PadR family transcriptional regulator